ncbi:hypothetical protein CsSME_00044022 [Camellia sinensis var. sinensis]
MLATLLELGVKQTEASCIHGVAEKAYTVRSFQVGTDFDLILGAWELRPYEIWTIAQAKSEWVQFYF